jgi:hypothetical protein
MGPVLQLLADKGLKLARGDKQRKQGPAFRGCLFQPLRSAAALAENGIGDAVFGEHPLDALGSADDGARDLDAGEIEFALEAFQHTGDIGKAVVLPSCPGCLRCDGGPLVLAEASGSGITSLCPPFRNLIRHTSSSFVAMVLASRRASSFCKHTSICACKSFGRRGG